MACGQRNYNVKSKSLFSLLTLKEKFNSNINNYFKED